MNTFASAETPAARTGLSTRKLNVFAVLLDLVAIGLPFAALALGIGTAYQAGADLPIVLIVLAVLSIVVGAFTSKSARAKAKGRIAVGVLLMLFACYHVALALRENSAEKKLAMLVLLQQQKQTKQFADLGARLGRIQLNNVITRLALTTPDGMAQSRATLADYKAILQERQGVIRDLEASAHGIVDSLPPGATHDDAARSIEPGIADSKRVYAAQDVAQFAQIEAMTATLGWAQAQHGTLELVDGQLLFKSDAQKIQLGEHLKHLKEAENQVNKAVADVRALQPLAEQKLQESAQAIEKLLKQ